MSFGQVYLRQQELVILDASLGGQQLKVCVSFRRLTMDLLCLHPSFAPPLHLLWGNVVTGEEKAEVQEICRSNPKVATLEKKILVNSSL